MKLQILLILSLLMTLNTAVNAKERQMVTSERGEVTAFNLAKNLTGYVKFKKCKTCSTKRFKITPEIIAYNNNKKVELSRFVSSKIKPTSLVFFSDNGELAAMRWFIKR